MSLSCVKVRVRWETDPDLVPYTPDWIADYIDSEGYTSSFFLQLRDRNIPVPDLLYAVISKGMDAGFRSVLCPIEVT